MNDINIDLPDDLIPDDVIDIPITHPASVSASNKRYLDVLTRALESDNGIGIPTPSMKRALAMRQRFYNARRDARSSGITSFDSVTLTISEDGHTLFLIPDEIDLDAIITL